jgi:hypothetical protein
VLARTPPPTYQRAALNGPGHWHHAAPDEVPWIVRRWLQGHPQTPDELRAHAAQAAGRSSDLPPYSDARADEIVLPSRSQQQAISGPPPNGGSARFAYVEELFQLPTGTDTYSYRWTGRHMVRQSGALPRPALRPARSVRPACSACPRGRDASLADGVCSRAVELRRTFARR